MEKISLKGITIAKQKYDSEILKLELLLKEKVDFEFSIMHQPSDGLVIVHAENMENARLANCISIINEKGKLTYQDYRKFSI